MNLISITTRCETLEAFIDLFHRYIDPEDQALFIAAPEPREVGTRAPFQIRLRDGSIVMRGEAEVVRRWPGLGLDSPWARPGYCIKLSSLETEAQELYAELVDGARKVGPAARRMVPPVAAPQPKGPEAESSAEASPRTEGSFPIELGELIAQAPAAVSEPEADPLWGERPPPPPPRPALVELVRRSRRVQIVAGVVGGVFVGALLALATRGGGDHGLALPALDERAPAPPISPVPLPPAPAAPSTGSPPAAAADPAEPEPAPSDEPPAPAPDRRPSSSSSSSLVTLDLRSEPPGAVFWVDGKRVGKAPLRVKVKRGKVKVSAQLKGYAEWKNRIRVRDDKRVTARFQGRPRF